LRIIVLPTTEGSPPKRLCHVAKLSTTTLSEFGVASSSLSPRPISGSTPSTGKRFGVTYCDGISTGSPSPVRLTFPSMNAAIASND
jgi:hypothetical protein